MDLQTLCTKLFTIAWAQIIYNFFWSEAKTRKSLPRLYPLILLAACKKHSLHCKYLVSKLHIYFLWNIAIMAVQVVEFSSGGVQNQKGFCLTINIHKGKYWILRIGVMGRCQKVPKFSMSKFKGIFLNFFHWKIPI